VAALVVCWLLFLLFSRYVARQRYVGPARKSWNFVLDVIFFVCGLEFGSISLPRFRFYKKLQLWAAVPPRGGFASLDVHHRGDVGVGTP